MKNVFFLLVFVVALVFGVVVWQFLKSPTSGENKETLCIVEHPPDQENTTVKVLQKQASFENVSFSYDTSLFTDIKGEIIPASALKDPTAKPDNVYSKHVNFTFQSPYTGEASSGNEYYSSPIIHVYSINEYKQAYLFYEINLDGEFKNLKKVLAKNSKITPSSGERQLPYIPYADAHQTFQAHAQILNFKNGKGLLFLTQWVQDELPINNKRLEYVFQGLTKDGKYFVYMEFPVSSEVLPDNDDANYPQKYEKLNYYSTHSGFADEKFRKLYAEYAFETAVMLNNTSTVKFTPNLSKIENLIKSLKIE